MKPSKALLPFLAAFAVSSFPLQAATINLDLTTNNPAPISLAAGGNTFSYTSFGVDYLIVGGGGGGGGGTSHGSNSGGGGGAGGLREGSTNISGLQNIVIGGGGAGGNNNRGTTGQNSSALGFTSLGGGGGGFYGGNGLDGGSGGGAGARGSFTAGFPENDGGLAVGGAGSLGHAGGSRLNTNTVASGGGGAGGAGANGGTATGGAGVTRNITGADLLYARGGSGTSGIVGVDNTGGGGGGAGTAATTGAVGGSGIVVVRYTGSNLLTGGLVSTLGGDTVHQFTETGSSDLGFNATIAGNIDGAGDLAWDGGGTLTLSGTNSYSGTTSVAFGNTLILNGDNTGATGAIDIAGTMAFGPSFDNTHIPAALGRVVTTSTGTVAVDNHTNFNFNFGTPGLTAAYLGTIEDLSYNGILTPQGTTYRLGGGGGTLTMAIANAITGANSLIVRSNVILPVANNHDGGTTLNADSTLSLGNNGSLGSGTFTIAGASTIQATGAVNAPNAVSANADFTVAGAGALTLGGITTINANRTITNNNTTNPTVFVDVSLDGTSNRNLVVAGPGDTSITGSLVLGTGILTKNDSGTLTLSGVNEHGTTASGGTLVLAGSNSSATNTTLNAATLQLNSDSNGGLASGPISITQNAGVLQAINADRVIANDVLLNSSPTISGTQSLTINGTMTINTANRILTNSISGTGKALTLANINRDAANNRNLTFSGNGDTTVTGGVVLGTGTLTKNGAGTLTLEGANTYTGNTTVASGTLALVGGSQDSAITVPNGAFLSFTPGSPTTSTKALTLNSGSKIRINGTPAASSYTLITAASIGGTGTPTLEDEIIGYELQKVVVVGGDELRLVKTGSATPYDTWATGGELFGDDANNDGVSNGLAFLLGASGPNVSALDKLPTVTETAGGLVLNFSMRNTDNRGTAALAIEHSNSLATGSWTTVSVPDTAGETTLGAVTFNVTLDSPLNTVTATISSSAADGGKLFGRLKATE